MATEKLPPLEEFNAQVVQKPLRGLLFNIDREIEKRLRQAHSVADREGERRMSLLLIMVRVTINSYEGICFLVSSEEHPGRKKEFALVVPPANRQLFDLLFTLVFMFDDFPKRSMDYELSGYRQFREMLDRYHARFGAIPSWQKWFDDQRDTIRTMEAYMNVSAAQKANPSLIPYWRSPFKLKLNRTKSQSFMEYLDKWFYGEVSAQAHLNAAGLLEIGQFVLTDLAPDDMRQLIETRTIRQYTFRQFTRTLITVLAIASEISVFCSLANRTELAHIWGLLSGWAKEAQPIYEERYRAMLV